MKNRIVCIGLGLVALSSSWITQPAETAGWGGYTAGPGGYIDTTDWLGWLQIDATPWLWSVSLGSWIYAPDPGPDAGGAWAYVPLSSAVEPPVQTVDLTEPAGSLRFPYNNHETANPDYKGLLKQSVTGFPNLLGADGAFFIKLHLPLARMWANRAYQILGTGGSGGNRWAMAYAGGAYWSAGSRGRMTAYLRGTSGDTITPVSAPVTEQDILVVFRRTGDQFALDWYSLADGSHHAGEPVAGATNGTRGQIAQFWTVGCTSTTGTIGSLVEPNGAFPGEISHMGYLAVASEPADWQSIALGADPLAALGEQNLTYYRRLRGPDPLSLAAASSADLALPLEIIPGNAAFEPGSTIGRQDPSAYLTLDGIPDGYVYGLRAGEEGLVIPFSGTSSIDGDVQVQLVYEDGTVHHDWRTVGKAAGGVWQGELYVKRCARGWVIARARIHGSGQPLADQRARFAVGYKIGMLGQSQMAIYMGSRGGGQQLVNPGRYSFSAWHWVSHHNQPNQIHPMANMLNPDSVVVTANQLDAYPGRDHTPMAFISLAKSGMSALDLIDDAQTGFQWAELEAVNASLGGDYTCLMWQWGSADVGRATSYGNLLNAVVLGTGPMAADHFIHDGSIFIDKPPLILSPFSRQATTAAGPFDTSQGGSYATMRANQVAWFTSQGYTVGPHVSDMRVGPTGGPHQAGDGLLLVGQRFGVTIARHLGWDSTVNPSIQSIHFTSPERTAIQVTFNLPNSGSLKTNGMDSAVSGFEVSADGGLSWSRSGFSAVRAGDTVILTRQSGSWPEASTKVSFMAGGPLSFGTSVPEDDFLPGVLYESNPLDVLGIGLPVDGGNTAYPVGAAP